MIFKRGCIGITAAVAVRGQLLGVLLGGLV
jgi:hypothetical protein